MLFLALALWLRVDRAGLGPVATYFSLACISGVQDMKQAARSAERVPHFTRALPLCATETGVPSQTERRLNKQPPCLTLTSLCKPVQACAPGGLAVCQNLSNPVRRRFGVDG